MTRSDWSRFVVVAERTTNQPEAYLDPNVDKPEANTHFLFGNEMTSIMPMQWG